jgi:hypothetical protein
MRPAIRKALVCALALGLTLSASAAPRKMADAQPSQWREDYAYSLGMQAYIYGFPWIFLPTMRWNWTVHSLLPKKSPDAPVNHFWHARRLANASYRFGGAPNNDTLYSIAWLDVTREPIILSVPDMGERYYTFEFAGIDSDNFAYVGKRATGSKAGNYAIVGPGWHGTLPPDVVALPPSHTPWVLVMGRTLVNSAAELPAVHALQDQYRLTPLSLWGEANAKLPSSREVLKPFDVKSDPLAEWKTMNAAMTENPPPTRHAQLMKLFATIGVGPGQDIDKMNEGTKRGLARAAKDGRKFLGEVNGSGELGTRINHWNFPAHGMGRAGDDDNFLLRASMQCLGGIVANDPEEGVYVNTTFDNAGQKLDAAKRYVLHFSAAQLPKVKAFWSLTIYGLDLNLIDNPLNRYSIGDRTPNVKYDADGGLTVFIQASSPGGDKESNWLPTTKTGGFFLVMRTYIPDKDIIDQTWQIPGIVEVK